MAKPLKRRAAAAARTSRTEATRSTCAGREPRAAPPPPPPLPAVAATAAATGRGGSLMKSAKQRAGTAEAAATVNEVARQPTDWPRTAESEASAAPK